MHRLTKQRVRHLGSRKPRRVSFAPFCDHRRMRECHPGCGHFSCPCGLTWDDGAGM